MVHMIDPNAIPTQVFVGSFLKAMAGRGIETCVVFRQGTAVATASNRDGAETMAKAVFAIEDGALEVAAIALHASRLTPPAAVDGTDPDNTETIVLCSLVACAGHELEKGAAVPWDALPEQLREVHRTVAKAVVGSAVAHKAPEKSSLIKPA